MKNIPELLVGFRRFQLLYVALRLKIPQVFVSGPKTLAEIATATGLHEQRLLRILRGLLWAEVLVMNGSEQFTLSADCEVFSADSPALPTDDILFQGRFFYQA